MLKCRFVSDFLSLIPAVRFALHDAAADANGCPRLRNTAQRDANVMAAVLRPTHRTAQNQKSSDAENGVSVRKSAKAPLIAQPGRKDRVEGTGAGIQKKGGGWDVQRG